MKQHSTNKERKDEGEVHKGLPEAAPNAGNAYEEDDHPATDNANEHGEIPRTRDDSDDHKKDPYQDQ
ncbi:hypothetical protein HA48_08225 [Pantoea wallisii]|uniref:Uncharacterized protein n=1 Tax=Pantoea wallisii TaxID=1076551 RepID=A0A1X1DAF1_9GAMM|nr:hypothetical protein [Pantoea wallisii]ORM73685.1 hypothetical protein HA48_08225 [Pantoea wallisii]